MGRLDGKVAIVTGAASGQGAAEARLFAREGAKVVATDLQEELLAQVVNEINQERPLAAIAVKHNVANEKDWDVVVSEAVKHFGKIDILVNNAGIGSLGGMAGLEKLALPDWDKTLEINLKGNFLGMRKVAPEMRKAGKGSIINISSIAAIIGGSGGPAYSASKGANRALTKNIGIELAKDNIRVNSIHPGYIRTPMTNFLNNNPKAFEEYVATIPLGVPGEPEDIAHAALFLASDEARFITCAELVVDGGQIAH